MIRISAIAATAVLMTAPAFAMGCSYGNHSTSTSAAETFVPSYTSTATTASATEEVVPLQSTPIDPAAIVLEEGAASESVEPIVVPEG